MRERNRRHFDRSASGVIVWDCLRSLEESTEWVNQLQAAGGCDILKAFRHIVKVKNLDKICLIVGSMWVTSGTKSDAFSPEKPGSKYYNANKGEALDKLAL